VLHRENGEIPCNYSDRKGNISRKRAQIPQKESCKKGMMTQKKSREKQRILEDYPDKYGKNTVYNEKY